MGDCTQCTEHERIIKTLEEYGGRLNTLERKQDVTDEKIANILTLLRDLSVDVKEISEKLTEIQHRPDTFKVWLVEIAKHFVTIGVIGGVLYAGLQNLL